MYHGSDRTAASVRKAKVDGRKREREREKKMKREVKL